MGVGVGISWVRAPFVVCSYRKGPDKSRTNGGWVMGLRCGMAGLDDPLQRQVSGVDCRDQPINDQFDDVIRSGDDVDLLESALRRHCARRPSSSPLICCEKAWMPTCVGMAAWRVGGMTGWRLGRSLSTPVGIIHVLRSVSPALRPGGGEPRQRRGARRANRQHFEQGAHSGRSRQANRGSG